MSSEARPAKRVRQACDPCRRKKSRCPGEKPTCSYCARLGQQCTYTDEPLGSRPSITDQDVPRTPTHLTYPTPTQPYGLNGIDTTKRLDELESKISEVLSALRGSQGQNNRELNAIPATASQHQRSLEPDSPSPPHIALPSHSTLQKVADLYLKYCHCQPLPLFASDDFLARLSSRDEEVTLAISACAIRFSPDSTLHHDEDESVQEYLEKSRLLTTRRLITGSIELSTLQSLCLLSWLDFYDGNTHRASMYTSTVSDLCKSANLGSQVSSDDLLQEEKLRCFWTVVLLQRLHPNISKTFNVSFDEDNMPPYPKSTARPPLHNQNGATALENRATEFKDLGIMAYAIQLTEVWYKVAHYAHRRASAGPHAPWSSESDYAKIIEHQMDSETNMPYSKHRFKPVKFEERDPEELFRHRDYWSPWLFTQILYHTIICVLNHPLLLSLRLRNFRVASIPEIWLQHTDDLISQHSQWIIHLLDILDSKSYIVSDPFLAHCVAIVATIHLQQSFSDDGNVQETKKENFQKCLRFCQQIGDKWPYIQELAKKLQDFESAVSQSYHNSAVSHTNNKIFIDLSLFWEILESSAVSSRSDLTGLRFGQSLKAETQPLTSAEELNSRLLPETSRVAAAGSPATALIGQPTPNMIFNASNTMEGQPYPLNEDFGVLAQSYFAQGQDFVGNMDDWWLMDYSNQTA